ncbi:serine/threonine-protein kinase [Stieleria varia]|uniref:Serine/threonine-protein kinase PknL n=1 Tax=Stieleria varia TaxID=2528005 RepID=A0A5C6A4Z9_9BACT|nr:serine/threonine-protein kinase [Stieleria varia]TWT94549.1 Serine/threonine-protein kinase PknL [Stieleria varia]
MIDQRYSLTGEASLRIESLLSQFERDRDRGPIEDFSLYTPPIDDPAYAAVVTELARVDLEHRFDEEGDGDASRYIDAYPDVFAEEHCLLQITYEEYRLRRLHGEDVQATTVASRYGIDGSRWIELPLGDDSEVDACGNQCDNKGDATSRRYTPGRSSGEQPTEYPHVGDLFASYQLVAQLGEGAFSRVFLARQSDLADRFVVLKVTPLETRESDKLARLQHSNIIPIFSVHRERNLSCICMPFLGTTTLAEVSASGERWAALDGPAEELISTILARRQSTIKLVADSQSQLISETPDSTVSDPGSMRAEQDWTTDELLTLSNLGYVDALVTLAIGAVEGVAHAHRRGIVHRDLKPANILVTDDGTPVLLDFNLAIITDETDNRVVGGTLPYMSPEQLDSLRTGAQSFPSDDVFAIGVILYELLSGHLPFSCPDSRLSFDLDQVIADRKRTPRSLSRLNSHVSPGLAAIVQRCISPQAADRYQDGSELLEDLRRHRQDLLLRYAPNHSLGERLRKWTRRHPRLASASTVTMVAMSALLAITFFWWQGRIRNERLNAEVMWQHFSARFPATVMALSSPGLEPEILTDGLQQSNELLQQWNVDSEHWRQRSHADRLDADQQARLSRQLARLLYLSAATEIDLAYTDKGDDRVRQSHLANAEAMNRRITRLEPEFRDLASHQNQRIASFYQEKYPNDPLRRVFSIVATDDEGHPIEATSVGSPSELLQLISVQLDREPTNAILWFQQGAANMRMGDLNQSLFSFDTCDRLHPKTVATVFNRGLCHLELGKHREAMNDFAECLRIKPGLTNARFNHAVAAHRMGDHRSALTDLNQLIDAGDPRTRTLLFRAEVFDAMGESKLADRDRAAARSVEPSGGQDYLARGVSMLSESPKQSLADFQAAVRLDSGNADALLNIAHVQSEFLDQPEQAIKTLDRLAALRPQAAFPVSSRGILRARVGQWHDAITDAQSAAELSPGGREQMQIAGIYAMVAHAESLEDSGVEQSPSELRGLAFMWLARAINSDASLARVAIGDPDLLSLRQSPQFQRLIGGAEMIRQTANQPR